MPTLIDVTQLWLIQLLNFLSNTPQGYVSSLVIIFFAALSYHLGQSFILLTNRVTARRFFFSLGLSISLYVLGVYVWIASLYIILDTIFFKSPTIVNLSIIMAVAYIPKLFDILVLTPHFGSVIAKILNIVCFLELTFLLEYNYSLSLIEALACSSLGFVVISFFQHSVGTPYIKIARFFKQQLET